MPVELLNSRPVQIAAGVVVVLAALAVLGMWCYSIVSGRGDLTQPGDILSGLIYGGGVIGGGAAVHYIHSTRKEPAAAVPASEQVHAPVAQGVAA